jgi:hypothetical protein
MTLSLLGRGRYLLAMSGLALVGTLGHSRNVEACGCFTPPDPSVPIVQAGEDILFSIDNGTVTAHIQIKYSGAAQDFGWLLPLPSVPTLQLGTDELFANLLSTTQPKYRLNTQYNGTCGFQPQGRTFGPTASVGQGGAAAGNVSDTSSVVVVQDSIGPYDYAVLKADSQDDMLNWLSTNHYFVPTGTDQTVGAYIHPGAFFLALKLRSGNTAGDLQPVVVQYPSDIPMIPIVLTSVAAQPHMGIQVWMLGGGRAIPDNYYHTVISDLAIDWANAGQNYNDVIIKATGEAPDKHSFVTEYAGSSSVMQKILNAPGRFGTQADLAASPDATTFVQYLQQHGFVFTSQLTAILAKYIPVPTGLTASTFFGNIAYYLGPYMTQNPAAFTGWTLNYDPVSMAQDIQDRVVQPTLDAGALFDKYPTLTRLYTTLSPEDMTKDPTFTFSPTLPNVSNVHQATLSYYCGTGSNDRTITPARLVTEQGWTVDFPDGTGQAVLPPPPTGISATRRLEVLSADRPPNVITDNPPPGGCACDVAGASRAAAPLGAVLLLLAVTTLRLRRSRATGGRHGRRA